MISKELNPMKYFQLWLCYDTLEDFEEEESWVNGFRSYRTENPVQVECNCYVKAIKQKKVMPYVRPSLIKLASAKYGADRVCIMAYDEKGELKTVAVDDVEKAGDVYQYNEGINSLLENYERLETIRSILVAHGSEPELAEMWAPAVDTMYDIEVTRLEVDTLRSQIGELFEIVETIAAEIGL